MAIRVGTGAGDTICDYADGFVLHVTEVADVDAARRALAAAGAEILALSVGGGSDSPRASNPVIAPGGPLMRITGLDAPEDVLQSIPDLLVGQLKAAGVVNARVDAPEPGGPLDRLDTTPNAVVLRLFPAPAGTSGTLPASWIDVACEWVLGDLAPRNFVPMRLLSVEFAVAAADAPTIVHEASLAGAWCDVVNGALDERVRTASITFGRAPHVALAAGGPACDSTALLARLDLLCEVARELAPDITYACVDVEATFEGVGLGLGSEGWRDHGGASPNLVAGELSDLLVPDVFPFQVLSKGHLAGLLPPGAAIDALAGGEPLGGGRVGIAIGDPVDWLPIHDRRADVQAAGFELLAPLLATEDEVEDLLAARPHRQVPDDGRPLEQAHDLPSGLPDLDDIVLETVPHARRGLRLTFLELVSWLAHQRHDDAPKGVSPVLATYARWFASALDPASRQDLKPRAARVVSTATARDAAAPEPGDVAAAESDRVWRTTDWMIHVQAAAWLRLAGLVEAAGRLDGIGPTSDSLELLRAVDVLGSAISIAGRRIELTLSIAGSDQPGDAELVEQAAWEAWEAAAETAGWVAASEAASIGLPPDLAYTTELRVIECARDPRVREELEAARRSIGDSAWAAALHAIADQAWTAGWSAAQRTIDSTAVVPFQTALDRATRAAHSRSGLDDDAREMAIESAEGAARERLTRASLGSTAWRAHTHPWDEAWAAAADTDPNGLWARIQELTRAAVDDGPWEAGMVAARAAVDEVLLDAPNLVARSVGAALGREAAGIAARSVAVRAAAVARAQGGDVADVSEAAAAALAPTAADLQNAAFDLLDQLIAPS